MLTAAVIIPHANYLEELGGPRILSFFIKGFLF